MPPRTAALGLLTLLVLGLHGLLLAALAGPPAGGGGGSGGGASTAAAAPSRRVAAVQLRMVAADAPALDAAVQADAAPPSAAIATEVAASTVPMPMPVPMPAAAQMPLPLQMPVPDPGAAAPGPGEEYLPRSALSLAPQAASSVMLEYPPQAAAGRYRGVLTLFIDEQGTVRRVRVDSGEDELPAPFQDAARQAFMAARFTPGEVQGRPVRSRMRIAVEFEAQEAPGGTQDRGAAP